MDDKTDKVEYQFTGDVSGLQKAVQEAIGYLSKYENTIKDLTTSGNFNVSKTAFNSLNKTVNAITKQVNSLVKSLNKSSEEVQKALEPDVSSITDASNEVRDALEMLQTSTEVTSKDVKFLSDYLKNAQAIFTRVADKAAILSSSFKGLETLRPPHLENTAQQLTDIGNAAGNLSTGAGEVSLNVQNMSDKVSEAMNSMSVDTQQFKSEMQSMEDTAEEAFNTVGRVSEETGSKFRQFKGSIEDAGDSSDSATKDIEETGEAVAQLNPKVAAAIKVFKTFKKVVSTIGTFVQKAKKGFDSLKDSFSKISNSANSTTRDLKKLVSIVGSLGLGRAISEATKKSIEFIENLNLFTVAMGDSIDEAQRFIDRMSDIYGMDPSNLYRYSGYFYQLTDAIGSTGKASEIMSLSLTKAANDISSLFNVDVETVVNNLASGMQGMSRAVRKYGMDIRATTLQQTALNYGFTENVATTSEANRMALRYLTMMQQVKNATSQVTQTVDGATVVMGDFARNIETPANQLRILKEQASQVARAFGNFLIPVLQKTLYVVNGILMAVKELLFFFADLLGIDIGSFGGEISSASKEATDAVTDIGDAADKTAKKLRNLIAPFDELTILTEPKDEDSSLADLNSDALDPALLAALENMSLGLDNIRMKALDVRDKILEILGLEWDKDGKLVVSAGGFIDDLMHLWDDADYKGFGKRVAEFINQGIQWGVNAVDPSIYSPILQQKILTLAQILNGLVEGLDWGGLGTIFGNGFNIALGALDSWLTMFDFAQLGSSIATLFNNVISSVDWELFGKTLGDYVMAQVDRIRGFFETFDWPSLGADLAEGFMSLLNTIRWKEIGDTVATQVNGVIDSVRAFFKNYEWGKLGSNLAELVSTSIREINWHNLGVTFSDTIRALFRDVTNFLGELDWFSIGKAITEFIMAIDWLGLLEDVVVFIITVLGAAVRGLIGLVVGIFTGIGKDIAEGFQGGIVEGFKNIGQWLWDHLVDPVIRAVKGFFGIHSPSTVFAEIGDNVIQGFLNGIADAVKGIGDWIKQKFEIVVTSVKKFFGIGGSGSDSSVFKNIGDSIVSGLMSGLSAVGTKLSSWGSTLRSSLSNIFSGVQTTVSSAISSISSMASSAVSSVTSMARSIGSAVSSAASSARSALSNIGSRISSTVSSFTSPRVRMATGGVVRGPTQALIGEGRYSEAVIPLGNSPELEEMIDKIATAVSATSRADSANTPPVEVHVYVDGREITTAQNRVNRMYGRTQQNL